MELGYFGEGEKITLKAAVFRCRWPAKLSLSFWLGSGVTYFWGGFGC